MNQQSIPSYVAISPSHQQYRPITPSWTQQSISSYVTISLLQQQACPIIPPWTQQYISAYVTIYTNYDTNTETTICHITNLTLLQQSPCNLPVTLLPLYSWIPLSHNISRPLNTIQLYLSIQSQIYPLLPTITTMNIIGLLALLACYPRTTPAYPPYHG